MAQTAAEQQAAKNGTGRKRYVRTDAGSRRYKVPIGAEIGSARNAKAAEAQKDTAAKGRYEELVGGDTAAQAAALKGLNDQDLDKLADIAFSFKSSDPNVVRLRISARNEQSRRGRRIKAGQTESNPGKPAAPRGRVGSARTNLAGSGFGRASEILLASNEGARTTSLSIREDLEGNRTRSKSMPPGKPEREKLAEKGKATKDGSFPIRNVADLRKAIQAFGRAKPATRGAVARLIVRRARELNASHLVGSGIARAAGKPATQLAQEHEEAIELAGRWKHGFIPLDGVAMREKMEGRTGGKQWWKDDGSAPKAKPGSAGKSGGGDSARTEIMRINAAHDKAVAEAKRGGTTPPKFPYDRVAELKKQSGAYSGGKAKSTGGERTNVVKSGGNKPPARGDKVNRDPRTDEAKMKARGLRNSESTQRGASVGRTESRPGMQTPTGSAQDPKALARNYVKMHGEAKAREKLGKLKASGDKSPRVLELIDALESALR